MRRMNLEQSLAFVLEERVGVKVIASLMQKPLLENNAQECGRQARRDVLRNQVLSNVCQGCSCDQSMVSQSNWTLELLGT